MVIGRMLIPKGVILGTKICNCPVRATGLPLYKSSDSMRQKNKEQGPQQ